MQEGLVFNRIGIFLIKTMKITQILRIVPSLKLNPFRFIRNFQVLPSVKLFFYSFFGESRIALIYQLNDNLLVITLIFPINPRGLIDKIY